MNAFIGLRIFQTNTPDCTNWESSILWHRSSAVTGLLLTRSPYDWSILFTLLQYRSLALHGQIHRPKKTDGTTGWMNESIHEMDDDDDDWTRWTLQNFNGLLYCFLQNVPVSLNHSCF